ncbi:hypothetical protein [Companilactobacillus furfuricola]|uniref:hypothetical protein n=1 Tax=Companilactobacillus furfuricola TaxID=1462575 RepID=UPI000F7908B6|nr:hypothetical protein [Companilactobacillus furfuricola]
MLKTDRMIFTIDNKEISFEKILQWEFKRLVRAHKVLTNVYGIHFQDEVAQWIKTKNLKALDDEITRVKMTIEPDKLREALKSKYDLGNMGLMVAEKMSVGKRRFSTTEIYVPESDLSAQEIADKIWHIMQVNTDINMRLNLDASPDHFIFRQAGENVQEVVEISGGTVVPQHYFIHYNDMQGVQSEASQDYPIQIAGTMRLSNRTIVGAIRYQFKPEGSGFKVKILMEYPKLIPIEVVLNQQIHQADEFGHWISDVLDS